VSSRAVLTELDMKYYKDSAKTYHAIDKTKNQVFTVYTGASGSFNLEYWNNSKMDVVIEAKDDLIKISAAEFQEQFSKAVEFFHNETPFA